MYTEMSFGRARPDNFLARKTLDLQRAKPVENNSSIDLAH